MVYEEDSFKIIQIVCINVLISFTVSRLLLRFVLQDGMTQNAHSHIHRFDFSHDVNQGFFDLYNGRVISHRTRMLVRFGLNKHNNT